MVRCTPHRTQVVYFFGLPCLINNSPREGDCINNCWLIFHDFLIFCSANFSESEFKMTFYPSKIAQALGCLALAGLASGPAIAASASSNSATAGAQAQLVQPIKIQRVTDLFFGLLAAGATGTVTIDATSGSRSAADDLVVDASSLGIASPQAAVFTVQGEPNISYGISGGEGTISLFNTSGNGEVIQITLTGVHVQSVNGVASTGVIGNTGSDTLRLGAQLQLSNNPTGIYENPTGIILTVDYN